MKNLSILRCFSILFLWNGVLLGQSPYCKKILVGPDQDIVYIPSMHYTPDGNWLFSIKGTDFIGVSKMSPNGTILSTHRASSASQFYYNILDVWELPNGDMLCTLEYDNDPGLAGSIHFLKYFTPDFTEVWSQEVQYRSTILPVNANQFIISSYNQIFKITTSGQVLWAKELDAFIRQSYLLPSGNILVSLKEIASEKADLILLNPEGEVIRSLDLSILNVWGAYVDIFPGGDILATYTIGYGVECQRFSSDLNLKDTWRITGSGIADFPQATIANDSLIYFHWQTGEGPSSILGTMDGAGNLLKSVVLPFFLSFYLGEANLPNGATGWCGISPLIIEPGMLVYSLDSSLTLPNCSLPVYDCLESNPVSVQNQEETVTLVSITLTNQPYSVPWEQFPATIQDTCISYTIPNPFFALQDTLCVGATLIPDSLMAINTGSNAWILNIAGNEADTLFSYAPELLFDKPGMATVLHQVYYLGCQVDSFSRTITVLPGPTVSLGRDTTFCNNTSVLLNPMIEGATHWTWGDQDTTLLKSIDETGRYILEATNGICSASDTIEINFGKANAAFGVATGVCSGAFFTPVPDEMGPVNHLWHWEPAILPDAVTEQPDFGINTPGDFQLSHILIIEGCSDTVTHTVQVVPAVYIGLPPSAIICSDSILYIKPDTGSVIYAYWENGSTVLERKIEDEGVFYLVASNEYCSDTATIVVEVQACEPANIYIPNIFAPNSNDANSSFQAYYNEAIEKVDLMEIYDRWGSLIFRTTTGESWDGALNGRPATPGVYVYVAIFSLVGGGEIVRKGGITLVR
jgi:gliding motility-associated-like protein